MMLSSNADVVTNFVRTYFSVYERFAKVQIITAKGVKLTQVHIKYHKSNTGQYLQVIVKLHVHELIKLLR